MAHLHIVIEGFLSFLPQAQFSEGLSGEVSRCQFHVIAGLFGFSGVGIEQQMGVVFRTNISQNTYMSVKFFVYLIPITAIVMELTFVLVGPVMSRALALFKAS